MTQNVKSSKAFRWAFIGLFLALIPAAWWLLWADPRVEVVEPRTQAVVDLVISSGKIRSARQSEVGSEVAGVVVNVRVKEGDWVTSGQELVDLEVVETLQKLEQSRLVADTARQELNRVRRGPRRRRSTGPVPSWPGPRRPESRRNWILIAGSGYLIKKSSPWLIGNEPAAPWTRPGPVNRLPATVWNFW